MIRIAIYVIEKQNNYLLIESLIILNIFSFETLQLLFLRGSEVKPISFQMYVFVPLADTQRDSQMERKAGNYSE